MTCLPSDDPGRPRPHIRWVFGAWTRYPWPFRCCSSPGTGLESPLVRGRRHRDRAESDRPRPAGARLPPLTSEPHPPHPLQESPCTLPIPPASSGWVARARRWPRPSRTAATNCTCWHAPRARGHDRPAGPHPGCRRGPHSRGPGRARGGPDQRGDRPEAARQRRDRRRQRPGRRHHGRGPARGPGMDGCHAAPALDRHRARRHTAGRRITFPHPGRLTARSSSFTGTGQTHR